jgi:hypothetical protein
MSFDQDDLGQWFSYSQAQETADGYTTILAPQPQHANGYNSQALFDFDGNTTLAARENLQATTDIEWLDTTPTNTPKPRHATTDDSQTMADMNCDETTPKAECFVGRNFADDYVVSISGYSRHFGRRRAEYMEEMAKQGQHNINPMMSSTYDFEDRSGQTDLNELDNISQPGEGEFRVLEK